MRPGLRSGPFLFGCTPHIRQWPEPQEGEPMLESFLEKLFYFFATMVRLLFELLLEMIFKRVWRLLKRLFGRA
jgi:hypothetical protein